mmetsp:Transcript_41315/g.93465  ORF Transcript_41315/g.93465 Transcript_41315/m.93465 type:complete len:251 (-) Transcript_41315:525-1277(-)
MAPWISKHSCNSLSSSGTTAAATRATTAPDHRAFRRPRRRKQRPRAERALSPLGARWVLVAIWPPMASKVMGTVVLAGPSRILTITDSLHHSRSGSISATASPANDASNTGFITCPSAWPTPRPGAPFPSAGAARPAAAPLPAALSAVAAVLMVWLGCTRLHSTAAGAAALPPAASAPDLQLSASGPSPGCPASWISSEPPAWPFFSFSTAPPFRTVVSSWDTSTVLGGFSSAVAWTWRAAPASWAAMAW